MKLFTGFKQFKQLYIIGVSASVVIALLFTTVFPQIAVAEATQVVQEFALQLAKKDVQPQFPEVADVDPAYEIWVLATAYSSDVAQTDSTPCIPAMGSFDLCEYYEKYGRGDTIAANFLPLGKTVRFELSGDEGLGDHVYMVRDRMNSKYNGMRRVDVWMPTRAEAITFGARWMKMKVYPYR